MNLPIFPVKKHSARAFTLIELLVVIAIIAVLAALIFPAIGSVQAKSKQNKCLHQVRQWANVITLYAADNQQQVVWGGSAAKNPWSVGSGSPYAKYFADTNIQNRMRVCPVVPFDPAPGSNPQPTYSFTRPNENGAPLPGDISLTRVPNPANLMLLLDSLPHNGTHIGGGTGANSFASHVQPICVNTDTKQIRHSGNVNALFADFHVQAISWDKELDPKNKAPNGQTWQAFWTTIQ